ncbi:endonuclease III [Planctomyces sp. SH-PL62]|uniref:endonuclease III n=1 Tax=Planctomyces sp. SH-PL62 TaxID=1636152 RepID=UPI00078D438F|nr:endonuclease III [Planctomyces sp. SH-PL62]AMV37417.1 Ultraviolet N-glycosylase/AP lyase [Planctomyces sp. SH-PL62]
MAKKKNPAAIDPKAQARLVLPVLKKAYPEALCALVHDGPFQLLVATILSAQCTDARVNMVTPELFQRFPDARSLAAADRDEVEEVVRSTGFFRAKARNLQEMAARLQQDHGGEVPPDLDALTALPGVGRKTANVVLGTAFGLATGVVVDTHVKRLSTRLGLTSRATPEQIERDLVAILPRDEWVGFSHRLIFLGRETCLARKPRCSRCPMADFCPRIGVTSSA